MTTEDLIEELREATNKLHILRNERWIVSIDKILHQAEKDLRVLIVELEMR